MENLKELTIRVTGMSCMHCEATVKRSLEGMEGIVNVEADNKSETVKITGSNIDLERVRDQINRLGYKYIG